MRPETVAAIRAAGTVRRQLRVPQNSPVCSFDICAPLGISVFFKRLHGLEGLSITTNNNAAILVNSRRPRGRQNFTCAHELGHQVLGHGVSVDQLSSEESPERSHEEKMADRFAAALLMPKVLVYGAFAAREGKLQGPLEEKIYSVSRELGVGYATLVSHMSRFLRCISHKHAAHCHSVNPKMIRRKVYGVDSNSDVLDTRSWLAGSAVHACVGDRIILPPYFTIDGVCVARIGTHENWFEATTPGCGVVLDQCQKFVRTLYVMSPGYVGLARYRNMEAEEDD